MHLPALCRCFGIFFVTLGLNVWRVSGETFPDPASTQPLTNSPAASPADISKAVENSVVKIFATTRYPDNYRPWTKSPSREITGSGVVIEGKRILSNAHVALYASQIQVQANQSGDKISATVEFIAPGIDLAVLKLDDETFFDAHPPLRRANTLPDIKDAVMAYGFPEGGNSLSVTKGIVSRIEFAQYKFPIAGMRIQIDAAVNPGNSGGAAVANDQMIGLVVSRYGDADNIGYIIPNEEIDLFLKDIVDGRYDGKPGLFDEFQTMENPTLRPFLQLDKTAQGLIVHKPLSTDAAYPLKEWDVITKIGDTPVDNEGMVRVSDSLRVRFQYLIQKISKDGRVPLTIIRAGKELPVQMPLATNYPRVVLDLNGGYPSYFICGPLAFSTVTEQFIEGFRSSERAAYWFNWFNYLGNPIMSRWMDKPAYDGERLVVICTPFFPHKLCKGYSDPYFPVVKMVNGIPIKNLEHLVAVFRDAKEEFITIEYTARGGETFVFPRKEMLAATEEILTDNGVRSQGTFDVMTIWNAKPAQ